MHTSYLSTEDDITEDGVIDDTSPHPTNPKANTTDIANNSFFISSFLIIFLSILSAYLYLFT